MAKVLIVYHSRTGNTEKMARAVEQGVREANIDVELKKVGDATLTDLEAADGIILGSPTYFGLMSEEMKGFIDQSIGIWGGLSNKIGAAFASSLWPGGGSETTLLSLIQAMLTHEMIVVGGSLAAADGVYGALSLSPPDGKALNACKLLGKRVAELVEKMQRA